MWLGPLCTLPLRLFGLPAIAGHLWGAGHALPLDPLLGEEAYIYVGRDIFGTIAMSFDHNVVATIRATMFDERFPTKEPHLDYLLVADIFPPQGFEPKKKRCPSKYRLSLSFVKRAWLSLTSVWGKAIF